MYNFIMNIDLSSIPNTLGVYLWKNKYGKVIYVGKSKQLNKTMNQYISGNLTPRNKVLLKNIDSFEYFTFKNEGEVFSYEQKLINEYDPIFNIKVRPNKTYPYIEIKKGNSFKFTVSKTKKLSRAKYYGPYQDGKIARDIIELYESLFSIKWNEDKEKQNFIIEKIDNLYAGDFNEAYEILRKRETKGIDISKEYNLLNSIEKSTEKIYDDNRNVDIINFFVYDDLISICITYIRSGVKMTTINIINKLFNPYPEDAVIAFLSRYYSRNYLPDKIIIPFELEWKLDVKSEITQPTDDIEEKLSNFTQLRAEADIMNTAEKFMGKIKEYGYALDFMKKNSDVRSNAKLIEMIKISSEGEYKLATIVQYLEGKPRKRGYKKYILNYNEGIIEAISEHRLFKSKGNKIITDIFIVEGAEALEDAKHLFTTEKNISLVSVDSINGGTIDTLLNDEGESFEIEFNSHIYNFLSTIKKESDKFNKGFHRSRVNGIILETKLDGFKFLNELDKQKLFKSFKSYKRIMSATDVELGKVIDRTKVTKLIKERG